MKMRMIAGVISLTALFSLALAQIHHLQPSSHDKPSVTKPPLTHPPKLLPILPNHAASQKPAIPAKHKPVHKATITHKKPLVHKQTPTLSAPHILSSNQLIDLAKEAAISAYTYDYKNYRTRLNKTSKLFTQAGWRAYFQALKRSQNLDVVKRDSIVVTAKVVGRPSMIKQSFFHGQRAWYVRVPLVVSYVGKMQQLQQNLDVDVTLVSTKSKSEGAAVAQFIAKPVARG